MENGELRNLQQTTSSNIVIENVTTEASDAPHSSIQSLPPCDGGWAAWRLLLAAFVFEALLWGFPLSFGVFQDYYSSIPEFRGNPYISIVGTTASGISYISAPVIIPLIKRYGQYRERMIWIGWPFCILGLVAGSFVKSLGALIFTQGIMYGVGFVIFYYPILDMVTEYWVVRRGMAAGLLCSASGVSGAFMPVILRALLQKYGYPTTLRATAVALCVLTGPLIPLLKGRIPSSGPTSSNRTNWRFLRKPLFWIYSMSNFAMGLGYFFPSLYIPTYATSSGATTTQGALLLTVMSIAQVFGQLGFGYLSDGKVPLDLLAITSSLVAGVAVYTCWGLAQAFGTLAVFAVIYGFFAAGFTALWVRIGTTIDSEPTAAFAAFALLNLGKGVGNILAGPIGGALLEATSAAQFDTHSFNAVIIFTGSCLIASAAILAMCYVEKIGKSVRKLRLVLGALRAVRQPALLF